MTAAFQAGQQVRLTRGESEAFDTNVVHVNDAGTPYFALFGETWGTQWMVENDGWTIAVVEPPTPPKTALPTRPGIYRDSSGDAWCLESDGRWWFGSSVNRSDDPGVVQNAPFTALGSLKDHAEVIAKWLESLGHSWAINTAAPAIRREFGEASE